MEASLSGIQSPLNFNTNICCNTGCISLRERNKWNNGLVMSPCWCETLITYAVILLGLLVGTWQDSEWVWSSGALSLHDAQCHGVKLIYLPTFGIQGASAPWHIYILFLEIFLLHESCKIIGIINSFHARTWFLCNLQTCRVINW
jgi:hypothetical protein